MVEVDGISMILLSAHNMLAGMLKIPELEMTPAETDMLAKGVANVAKHYDVVAMSEKTAAWVNLGQVAAMVYGPRLFVAMNRRKQARPARKPAQAPNVPPVMPSQDGLTPQAMDLGEFGL